jgi:hypothetical protein
MKEISNDDLEPVLTEVIELGNKVKDRHGLRVYSEKLCSLCSIILNLLYGEDFKGIYPFCGLDIITPYLLGGNWLLFDDSWIEYQSEIHKYQIPYFEEALNADRISIINRSINDSKKEIRKFKPQIMLIKYAGTESNYKEIFYLLTRIISDTPLLVISCVYRNLEKYIEHSSAYRLSLILIGSKKELSLKSYIQTDYQTFFFLDRLKLYEFAKKGC